MERITIGVVGVGGMGRRHVEDIKRSELFRLAFLCDADKERTAQLAERLRVPFYPDAERALHEANPDALLIATPHRSHASIAIAALSLGIDVLVEKPIAVHAAEARRMIEAYEKSRARRPDLVFAAMFMQRTYGSWQKIRELVRGGALGTLMRATWIATDWFRTQHYYDGGGWRASWAGEGGGVLLNQCPHNLDLYQWLFGMPARITGFAALGKYHDIEVEDEVSAYFEHTNGMIGHFIASTAEAPGTNRLEITGERGRLVLENGIITIDENRSSALETIRTSAEAFAEIESTSRQVPFTHHGEAGHRFVIENFGQAISRGDPLIAPAVEGINSLILANAILYSHFRAATVTLPLDEEGYARLLDELARGAPNRTPPLR